MVSRGQLTAMRRSQQQRLDVTGVKPCAPRRDWSKLAEGKPIAGSFSQLVFGIVGELETME